MFCRLKDFRRIATDTTNAPMSSIFQIWKRHRGHRSAGQTTPPDSRRHPKLPPILLAGGTASQAAGRRGKALTQARPIQADEVGSPSCGTSGSGNHRSGVQSSSSWSRDSTTWRRSVRSYADGGGVPAAQVRALAAARASAAPAHRLCSSGPLLTPRSSPLSRHACKTTDVD